MLTHGPKTVNIYHPWPVPEPLISCNPPEQIRFLHLASSCFYCKCGWPLLWGVGPRACECYLLITLKTLLYYVAFLPKPMWELQVSFRRKMLKGGILGIEEVLEAFVMHLLNALISSFNWYPPTFPLRMAHPIQLAILHMLPSKVRYCIKVWVITCDLQFVPSSCTCHMTEAWLSETRALFPKPKTLKTITALPKTVSRQTQAFDFTVLNVE